MCLLLGETPHNIDRKTWEQQTFPQELTAGLPITLLNNRPDVAMAEYALEQSYYATNIALAAFYPSLTLSGVGGWSNASGGAIVNPGEILWNALGALSQPIFQNGYNKAQLKIAQTQFEENKLNFQQTLLQAGVEVNEALTKSQISQEKTLHIDLQIAALERAVKSTQLLMDHGTTTFLQVLVARQSLLQAQENKLTLWFDQAQGMINLYQALGGGTL